MPEKLQPNLRGPGGKKKKAHRQLWWSQSYLSNIQQQKHVSLFPLVDVISQNMFDSNHPWESHKYA